MCIVGRVTLKQHFSAYKKPVLYESRVCLFLPKVLYVCTLYFSSCQCSAVQCSVYYLWKIYRYKYFIFKLRSFIDSTDTFSQVLTFVLSTKVGDFPRIAFPRSLRKKQSLPLIQSKHSWFYLDRHYFQNECRKDRQCIQRFVSHLIPKSKTFIWPWIPR